MPLALSKFLKRKTKKILVLGQAYQDDSIVQGAATPNTFLNMLDSAIKENTKADIIIKEHPDMAAKARNNG